ncbi:MAG: Uma2 family endonuclease [Haliscomenobacter sp.]|nr:Uma2 family endonuclease [Haliscomenobacter sp.]
MKQLKEKKPATVEEPILHLSQLDPEGIYTYADYLRWQFEDRVELIRGQLMKMSPAPSSSHQSVSVSLTGQFWQFFRQKPCQVFAAPFDVRLPISKKKGQITTVVQPDLCVICDPAKIDERGCLGAPDLVVEILSPGNSKREMRIKFDVYQEAGVREYWMVHPLDRMVMVYVLNENGRFIGLQPVTDDTELRPAIFPDLVIDLKEVFA